MASHKRIFNKKSLFVFFILICVTYYLFKSLTSSVFLKGRDKINVVFYGEKVRFYSLDKRNINYFMPFSNLIRLIIPGGYDKYKVGAIGKLVSLEKNPEIIKRVFSLASSSMIDLYFYQKKPIIYFDNSDKKQIPTVLEIFLTNSNANLVDKLFLINIFLTKGSENFEDIDLSPFETEDGNLFDYNSFYKKYQGSFFQKTYRNSDINVQILYSKSYKTAQSIGQIIEGEGIRVVDLSDQGKEMKGCLLISSKIMSVSKTLDRLKEFFNCRTKIGETTVSDIILELGDLEKDWAIN